MARIDIKSAGATLNDGVLQLQGGVAMSSTLTAVADQNDTTSPLKLSTTAVQVVSPLRITTDDPSDMYLDCEDGSTNNRFNITRNTASQQVNLNFASNPVGSTTIVGAIRTYVDGVNLSEVMTFREDGNVGIDTTTISQKFQVGDGTKNLFSSVSTLAGNVYMGSSASTRFGFSGGGTTLVLSSSVSSLPMSIGNYQDAPLVLGVSNTEAMRISPTTFNVNINSTTDLAAKVGIKGSGSTSATTSLLVQNSGGTDLVRVQDNGVLTLGTFASGLGKIVVTCDPSYGTKSVLENNFGGQIIRQQSTDVVIFGGQQIASLTAIGYMGLSAPYIFGNNPQGNTTGSSFDFRVTGSPYAQTPSTPSRGVLFDGGLNFQSGGYANYFELSPTYTFDISNNRIVKGIYYNPTLVTPNTNDKHYGIQTTSGGAYINTTTPQDSACLQADSTTQGFLPPRMTDAQIRAIATPAEGLIAYNTDISHLCCYQAGAWVKFSHSPM